MTLCYVNKVFSLERKIVTLICFLLYTNSFLHTSLFIAGLANPAPIIQTFYAEDEVFNDVKLDGVVTLVDSKHVGFHLDEVKPKGVVNEALEQIAYADRIIVNKVLVFSAMKFNKASFIESRKERAMYL